MWENQKIENVEWIAFDLETSGKYPVGDEICEMAAVKWKDGKVTDQFQALVKPSKPMKQFVIDIHGITNEMVANSSSISDVIEDFYNFVKNGVMVAHHSPFDMGFLAFEFEKKGLKTLATPVFCSSLLSRELIPQSPNHRLITLANHLNISPGNSHRALDDAMTCLNVALECFKRFGSEKSLKELAATQGQTLYWKDFSIEELQEKGPTRPLIRAIQEGMEVEMSYGGGSRPGKPRKVKPLGIVRGPERDFLSALDLDSGKEKRYYLSRVEQVSLLS
ncbi:MAG TPA: exonuclease [Bdellovibrionales bacterium]|nr:exonuclease [Pseudobdellovibrionaceae bacterium]HAG90589.1 exonuclease [Bdellovibrionales bacterium]|tara:strand:- start:777 stop:1607 length:831 start_codon:yes stop_codon:yes gene_type:complete